jgi:signal transduction histidine kinase/CheY-like chemotaxis protein
MTNSKAIEEDLGISADLYYQLVSNIPGALYQYQATPDGIGKMNYLSARFSELFEISAEAAITDISVLFERVFPEDWDSFNQSFQIAVKHRKSWIWKGRIITPSGEIKWIRGESRPAITNNGALVWDGILIDISEQQTAVLERQQAQIDLRIINEQLESTVQKLQRATQLKDEFLATMSHELRTPLNSILGMSEALQEEIFGALSSQQLHAVSTIEHSGKHLLSLINDILDVSKISEGKLELEITKVSIDELCQSSLVFVKQHAIAKNIQITAYLPTNIDHILVDERRMCQILINLLNNAIKFTEKGGQVSLTVQVATPFTNQNIASTHLSFAVRDTGIGIAQEDLNKLFQPFVQLDSNLNRKYTGTGLGLVLVKQIAELHQGFVKVESELNQGCCFTVTIPQPHLSLIAPQVTPLVIAATNHDQVPTDQQIVINHHTTPVILLVEDNEVNVNTFSSYLTAKGYQITLAHNGHDAIAATRHFQPDLILMDIQMPDMDGITAIQHLRQQSDHKQVPIIALTARTLAGDREKCLAVGANEYLVKPVKLQKLHQKIQEYLDSN